MERIKGILAAGALTGLVLATSIGLGARNVQARQPNNQTAGEGPIIIERVVSSEQQPVYESGEGGGEYYEEEEWEDEDDEWEYDDD